MCARPEVKVEEKSEVKAEDKSARLKFALEWSNIAQCRLWTPIYFIGASDDEISKAIGRGGCGPGEFGDKLVPDKIWGLDVKPACACHDMSRYLASTEEDYVVADNMFLCNMLRLNDNSGNNKFIRWVRLKAFGGIYHYYEAVTYLGR